MKSNKLTNKAVNNLIGKNLRKIRDAKGKSRREVSEKLGVSAKSLEQLTNEEKFELTFHDGSVEVVKC